MKNSGIAYTASFLLGTLGSLPVQGVDIEHAKEAVEQKVYEITGKDTAVLTFQKGSSTLSEGDQATLKAMLNAIRESGPVQEIVVLSYADLDYPRQRKDDLPKASRELAETRGQAVKDKLSDLGASDIAVHSMATKASWFEKTAVTKSAQVKREAIEKAASTDADDAFYQALGQRLKTEGGAGKVVVAVRRVGKYAN